MKYGKICPILSINGYKNCKTGSCRLWLDDYNECAIKHSALSETATMLQLVNAVRAIANGITYSPSTDIPSISESAAIAADALSDIAGGKP